jgi:drug/metabolite transporter (DMT)-like permease
MFVGKLSVASVVYGFSFVMGFVMMGERMSMLQFVGVLVSFLGIGMMSI